PCFHRLKQYPQSLYNHAKKPLPFYRSSLINTLILTHNFSFTFCLCIFAVFISSPTYLLSIFTYTMSGRSCKIPKPE
ncbi:hypothetical protein CLOSTHATH_05411, partial [Hungatella hathewayi DSM 13479]